MVNIYPPPGTEQLPIFRGNEMSALDASAQTVDIFLQQDSSYPQLLDYFRAAGDVFPNSSGQNDPDYPGLTHLSQSLRSLSQIGPIRKVPLPAELLEQFGRMQNFCEMGLFPEIGRAWLSIDKDFFVWTYEDGGDLAYFDGLNETILSVGLVKPKAGIFESHIRYLLCLATSVEIVLLGVSFTRKSESSWSFDEMHLMPEPLFSLTTDNVAMMTICSSESGRIFLGSKDGSLVELLYQAEDGWFHRKCRKVNHSSSSLAFLVPQFFQMAFYEEDSIIQIELDESRHILYTLSEKGTIQVFDLGRDGEQMSKVHSLTHGAIVDSAVIRGRIGDRTEVRPVVHINALAMVDSAHIHLVAITQTGARLYFCATERPTSRPDGLRLVHVRFPPGHSVGGSALQPNQVNKAHYKKGTALLTSSHGEDNDMLWVMSNDTFPFQPRLIELHTTVMVAGRTWALAEVPLPQPIKPYCNMILDNTVIPSEPPVLVTQHAELPRKFVLLSPQGCHLVTKLRPVDQLRQLLVDDHGADCEAVKAYFSLLRESQACAVSLILACSTSPQDKQISEWATQAFFLYGGETIVPPGYSTAQVCASSPSGWSPGSPVPVAHSTAIGSPLLQSSPFSGLSSPYSMSHTPPHSPEYPSGGNLPQQQQLQQPVEAVFSSKNCGLYLYFSRILKPIWNSRLICDVQGSRTDLLVSSVSSAELNVYLDKLTALNSFLIRHASLMTNTQVPITTGALSPQLMNYLRPDDINQSQQEAHRKNLEVQERASIVHLKHLLSQSCEVLGLWKVLCDHQFHVVAASLSQEMQEQLRSFTCRDFIVAGADICSSLVTALIGHYLDDNTTTDAISHRLRDVCPSIFRTEDAIYFKANEKLVKVNQVKNKAEKEQLCKEALQLCQGISTQLQLTAVCGLFRAAHYHQGVVDLCLGTAQKRDPQELALHFFRNGEPMDDQQGLVAYAARMECYNAIMETLSHLLALSSSHPQTPSVPKVPGPPPPPEPDSLTPEEAKEQVEQVLEKCLQSTDELFHAALYTWLIEQNDSERVLGMKTLYLQNYLKRCVTLQPDNVGAMDLMWKYYEKNKNLSAAARILLKLAERSSRDVKLQQRLEYLSRAIICVKSSELRMVSSTSEGEFLHELEEKMEVARIQLLILETLQQKHPQLPLVINAISKLNADLLDITQLYEGFAEAFDLPECKLSIIHCAGHYDATLVENLWQTIIDRELRASSVSSPATRVVALGNKIQSLGRMYITSQKYFPLTFLVKHLEFRTCNCQFNPTWVYKCLVSLGVGLRELVELYHKLHRSRDPIWRSINQPLHLLTVLELLMADFADNPQVLSPNDRRPFASHCLDFIAGYLVDLQADPTEGTHPLTASFRQTQAKLSRMV